MLPPHPRAIAVLLLLAAAASAGPAAAAPRTPPKDTRERWVVGITVFAAEGLAPADAWLAWSIPLLLRDQLAGLGRHAIDADGRAAIARAAIARDRRAQLVALDGLRDARDAAAFGETRAAAAAAASTPTPAAALAEAMEKLGWLDGLDPSAVDVPDAKPIAFKQGPEPGLLLAAPFGSRGEAAAREDVDLLVGGSVREAAGYFLVDLWAWDAAREAVAFSWRDAGTRGEIYDRIAEGGRGLTGALLGRPWASLEVTAMPAGAVVLVDGTPAGAGRSRFGDLAPGTHEVKVSAPGYREEIRTVELAGESATTLAVALEVRDLGTIAVASEPPGADAWLDAVWQGRTPLDIPRPGERARLVVALPDGPETALTVGPSSPQRLSITLSDAVLHSDELQKAARDRFYGSFGWLVVSLPVPFYAYSWAYDWATEANRLVGRGETAAAQHAARVGTAYYVAYLGGLGASTALAAWTVYNIVRYVKAADRSEGTEVRP
jgi:hypothetical protein